MILRSELVVPLLAHMQDIVQTITCSYLGTAVPWNFTFLQEAIRCQEGPSTNHSLSDHLGLKHSSLTFVPQMFSESCKANLGLNRRP